MENSMIDKTVEVLLAGGVVALPTETVYGLATLWDNEAGRERIYQMKNRPANKLLQMLAADVSTACAAGLVASPLLEELAAKYWPGALTVVATAEGRWAPTIGLRIPDHPFLQAVLQKLGKPLAATSANLSGEPAAMTLADAVGHLVSPPDLAVDGGTIQHSTGASTVVDITSGSIKVLRQGAIVISDK